MRKRIIRVLLSFAILVCLSGCQKQGDKLLFLYGDGDITTISRNQGDCTFADHDIQWKSDGCELTIYYANGQSEMKHLSVGDLTEIYTDSIPPIRYEVYLCNEGDPLPEKWEDQVQKYEQKQAMYGSYGGYLLSRNRTEEMEMMKKALDAAGADFGAEDLEELYDTFTSATWFNGDCAFQFIVAKAEKIDHEYASLKLTLTDESENEMEIYANWDSHYIYGADYNGESYYYVME